MRKFKEAVKDGAAGRMGPREALETDLIRARMQGEMRRISVNASLNFDYCHDSAPFSGAVLPGAARFFEGLRFFLGVRHRLDVVRKDTQISDGAGMSRMRRID